MNGSMSLTVKGCRKSGCSGPAACEVRRAAVELRKTCSTYRQRVPDHLRASGALGGLRPPCSPTCGKNIGQVETYRQRALCSPTCAKSVGRVGNYRQRALVRLHASRALVGMMPSQVRLVPCPGVGSAQQRRMGALPVAVLCGRVGRVVHDVHPGPPLCEWWA